MFAFPDIFSFDFFARLAETVDALFTGIAALLALFGVTL